MSASALWLLLLGLLPVLAPVVPRAAAQGLLPQGGPIVRQIDVQYAGRPTINRERVLANMRTAIGQPFIQANVEEDIRNLIATGEVTNARIFSEPVGDGVKVIVIVATRASVKDIVFVGNQKIKSNKLLHQVTLKKGKSLNEETVETDRQKLLDYYHDKGFSDVDIKSSIANDDTTNSGTITYTINEGGKSALEHVYFEGNKAIKLRDLRHAMKDTRGKDIISFIDKSGRLDQTKLKDDLDSVRDLYQQKGYIDIDIPETRLQRLSNGDVNLVVVVREGPQYHVGALTFEGTQIFTDTEIKRFLKMKEGALYTPKGLKDDRKTIEDYYGSRGYVDTRVTPEGQPTDANKVNLHYKIDEGGQSFVESASTSRATPRPRTRSSAAKSPWPPATSTTPCSSRPPRSVWKTSATSKRSIPTPPRPPSPTAATWTCSYRKSARVR